MNYPAWQLKRRTPRRKPRWPGPGAAYCCAGCWPPAAARTRRCAGLLGQGEPLSDPFLLTDMDKAVVRIQERHRK